MGQHKYDSLLNVVGDTCEGARTDRRVRHLTQALLSLTNHKLQRRLL